MTGFFFRLSYINIIIKYININIIKYNKLYKYIYMCVCIIFRENKILKIMYRNLAYVKISNFDQNMTIQIYLHYISFISKF